MTDRQMLEDHLSLAERHIAQGERALAKQGAIVAELERDGHDASSARSLLGEFEQLQAMHVADRDRIARELAALEPNAP